MTKKKTTFCQLIFRLTPLTSADKKKIFKSFKIMHNSSYLGQPLVRIAIFRMGNNLISFLAPLQTIIELCTVIVITVQVFKEGH